MIANLDTKRMQIVVFREPYFVCSNEYESLNFAPFRDKMIPAADCPKKALLIIIPLRPIAGPC